jgi:acyl dehydratase
VVTLAEKMIDIAVGDELPPLTVEPISRTALALSAGASGDHNPIHIDVDVARSAGLDDVFAHGMLSMAYLGRLLTGWVPQERLRSVQVRSTAITPVHAGSMGELDGGGFSGQGG